jgi:hypothetical protein
VRVQPTIDYVVDVAIVEGIVAETARVIDVSVAGLGLVLEPPFDSFQIGQSVRVRIGVPGRAPFELAAVVRHLTQATAVWGVEFERVDADASRALTQAITDLMERA